MFDGPAQKLCAVLLTIGITNAACAPDQAPPAGGRVQNKSITSFEVAKRVLPRIYVDHRVTLYCGCAYAEVRKPRAKYVGGVVDLESCGIPTPEEASSRFYRLEWEHVMPAARFGSIVDAWKKGDQRLCGPDERGRECAKKASVLFDFMEGDLYNLYPESGAINAARSNKEPVEEVVGRKVRSFGEACQTRTGPNAFAPRPAVRGEIARTYFYMSEAYGIPLSDEERARFTAWSAADPVDDWECERARRIKFEQNNVNRFVEEACVARAKKAAEDEAKP